MAKFWPIGCKLYFGGGYNIGDTSFFLPPGRNVDMMSGAGAPILNHDVTLAQAWKPCIGKWKATGQKSCGPQ